MSVADAIALAEIPPDYSEVLDPIDAPFPWFGGKSRAASEIWAALGEVKNYVEPFAGSIAALLSAPRVHAIETVNDVSGYIANFWRAVQAEPDAVARWCDWPVNEIDLEARHAWLVARRDRLRWCLEDPDFYDVKIAGWWVWGQSSWIGSGWCAGTGPHHHNGVHFLDTAGPGIGRQLPHLGGRQGVSRGLPYTTGDDQHAPPTLQWMRKLANRLYRVRVACGDWSRVCTATPTFRRGLTGVFLDPPYGEGDMEYSDADAQPSVAEDVWQWAVANGGSSQMRIVVAAYDDGRPLPDGWSTRAWRAKSGYAVDKKKRLREVLYCSPNCCK